MNEIIVLIWLSGVLSKLGIFLFMICLILFLLILELGINYSSDDYNAGKTIDTIKYLAKTIGIVSVAIIVIPNDITVKTMIASKVVTEVSKLPEVERLGKIGNKSLDLIEHYLDNVDKEENK